VDLIHERMRQTVPVDDIEICGHVEQDRCACRKPKPGMLFNAAEKHGIALDQSWMIGDRWRDVDAGRAAGCRTVFVDYNYPADPRPDRPDIVVGSLSEAVPLLLNKT
jgi:D-glycero-D-manno-heptose 1,7-bisphosphate phosphatase